MDLGYPHKRRNPFSLVGGYPSEPMRTPDPNAFFRQNPFPGMIDPTWSVSSSFPAKTSQTPISGASGAGGGMNRVLKHLGAMESPELDWSLAAQKVGVTSPWSPTNVPYSPVAGLMGFDPEKKKRYA